MAFFSSKTDDAKILAGKHRSKKIRRIHHGLYTDNLNDPIEKIVLRYWMQIVPHIVSNGILSFRTAIELMPTPYEKGSKIIFVTSNYTKTITLPGLLIYISKGSLSYADQLTPNLAKSNQARALLENLVTVRKPEFKGVKTIGKLGVEQHLAKELSLHGEKRVNQIREEANEIAVNLGLERENKKLKEIIGGLLSSHPIDTLKTPFAKAVARGHPYDIQRLDLFSDLATYLIRCDFETRDYHFNTASFRNLAFFESYFSNYIEGTEFELDEAEDIAFRGVEINHRHADSHDVLAHFYLSKDFTEISRVPKTAQEFLDLLKERHAHLTRERPEIGPGLFKEKPNKAGNTFFVKPSEVIGTLSQAFDIYLSLETGLSRALFIHFLVSEVHPFNDGNGRLSRIMMNAELVDSDLFKIIVPTVQRENYLNGLRRASRDACFKTYCKVMDQCQAYTQTIDWVDYGEARKTIENDCAQMTADEGLPHFNRRLRELSLSSFPE